MPGAGASFQKMCPFGYRTPHRAPSRLLFPCLLAQEEWAEQVRSLWEDLLGEDGLPQIMRNPERNPDPRSMHGAAQVCWPARLYTSPAPAGFEGSTRFEPFNRISILRSTAGFAAPCCPCRPVCNTQWMAVVLLCRVPALLFHHKQRPGAASPGSADTP